MAHTHIVADVDNHFIVDPTTLEISNISGNKRIRQYDHNSEKITIEVPRYLENHDLLLCDKVEIHFANIATGNKSRNSGIYEVKDLKIDDADENTVVCSWLISDDATKLAGTLSFSIHFMCTDKGKVVYARSTEPCDLITISPSIKNATRIVNGGGTVQDIRIVRGTTNAFTLNVTDINGNKIILGEGQSFIFAVKKELTDEEKVITKIIKASDDGLYYVTFLPQDTADLECGAYYYDVGYYYDAETYYNIVELSTLYIVANVSEIEDGSV